MKKWLGISLFWLLVLLPASPSFAAGPEIFMAKGASAAAPVPIAVDSTSDGCASDPHGKCDAGKTSLTWAHTVTGSNTALVVFVNKGDSAAALTGVTYNGSAMTQLWIKNYVGLTPQEAYYMVAPSAGTHNVVVTFGSGDNYPSAGAVSFTGVNQTTPIGTAATAADDSIAPTVNVGAATGDLVIDGIYAANTPTKDASQTLILTITGYWSNDAGFMSSKPGETTTTMAWTQTSGYWTDCGVALKRATP